MHINFLKFRSDKIPSGPYRINDRLTIIPVQRMVRNTIDSELMIGNVYGIDRSFLMDFGLFHAFITSEIWTLRNIDSLLESVETKDYKKIDDFIEEQEAFLIRQDVNYPDYDKITPIHKLPLEMSYKEGYLRFINARANGLKIYEQIQLFVFALGLSSWQPFYDNLNLKDALNFTILESILGKPDGCGKSTNCDECGSKEIHHNKESLSSYIRNQLPIYIERLEANEISSYVKLVEKISGKRHGAYHGASYYNVLREMVHEERTIDDFNQKWTLEHTIKHFDNKPIARQVASLRFSNLVKFILINKLLDSKDV